MDIHSLLDQVIKQKASDLHLVVGSRPAIRIDAELNPVGGLPPLTIEDVQTLSFSLLSGEQKEILLANKEIDFSFSYGESARFRCNMYYQKGSLAVALRLLPIKIPTIEELNLPKILYEFVPLRQGFILVTGPTGHGKSTTLASIINEINKTRSVHILTVEDPIEYVYPKCQSIISQREMGQDTHSWDISLRSALREDPDVVLIGEMRDYETISSALTIAETGHLVFATLHTNSASQTIDRVVDVFPESQQQQVRMQLSNALAAVVSQRLVPVIKGGRVPAVEIMLGTPAVKNTVREGKTHLLDNIIQTSMDIGMMTLEMSLSRYVASGTISLETAMSYALRPNELARLTKTR